MKKQNLFVCAAILICTFSIFSCSNPDPADSSEADTASVQKSVDTVLDGSDETAKATHDAAVEAAIKAASQRELSLSDLNNAVFTVDNCYTMLKDMQWYYDVTDDRGNTFKEIQCHDTTTRLKHGDKFCVDACEADKDHPAPAFAFKHIYPLKSYIVTDTSKGIDRESPSSIALYRNFSVRDLTGKKSYTDLHTYYRDLKPRDTVLASISPKKDAKGEYWICNRMPYINGVKHFDQPIPLY